MSHKPTGVDGEHLLAQLLSKKLNGKLFALDIWDAKDEKKKIKMRKITNITPAEGRAVHQRLADGADSDIKVLFIAPSGQIVEMGPAATAEQIAKDARDNPKNGPEYEDKKRQIFKPGEGWVDP